MAGNFHYDRKKKSSSRLSGGLSVFGSGDYNRKKKFQSSVWRVGSGDYDRKKKVPVICLAGCAVVVLAITTGKIKVLVICLAGCQFLVLAITTGKKSSSRLSGGLVLAIMTGK